MEGNYQHGFYTTVREQANRHQPPHPPQQQQQQQQQHQQQHGAHYPLEMPIPYHTTPQYQSEYVVNQPQRTFPIPHSAAPMLTSIYHDAGPMILNSSRVHQAHQQPPFIVGCHGVKPSAQSENHVPAAIIPEPVVERDVQPITTPEPLEERNIPLSTTLESVVETNHPIATTEVHLKINAADPSGIPQDLPSKKLLQDDTQKEQSSPISHEASASPSAPSTSSEGPALFAALNLKKTKSIWDLPSSLSCRVTSKDKVEGVVAKETIEKGAEFGPITGTLMDEGLGSPKEATWEICVSGRVYHYIDASKTWMSHIRYAQTEEEQNMEAYQDYGEIYFKSTKVIEPGSELKVFYSEKYQKRVGIQTRLDDLKFNQDKQKFECKLCKGLFTSTKVVVRHIRCEHSKNRNKMRPLAIKKKRKPKSVGINVISLISKKPVKTKKKVTDSDQKGSVFKCGTCNKVFPSCGRLQAHEIFHEYNQDHTCPVCGKRQKNAQSWATHMETHKLVQEARPHKCNECNGRYKSKAMLRKHVHQIHGYPCRVCSERFSYKKDCTEHEKTHNTFIPTENALEYYVPDAAPDEPKDMLGKTTQYYKRPYKCRFCPKRYSCHKIAKVHEREAHTGEGTSKCPHCPKVFACESRMSVHLLVHQQTDIYRCTFCPRGFSSESALTRHSGEHTGLKPFKCEVCDKGFRNRKQVTSHRRRVHDVRPNRFFCSFCNRGFKTRSDHKRHEERHMGIRRYKCQECGKMFTSNTSLTAHVQALHLKVRPYACEICGKTFTLNYKYTLHMVKHNVQHGQGSSMQQ